VGGYSWFVETKMILGLLKQKSFNAMKGTPDSVGFIAKREVDPRFCRLVLPREKLVNPHHRAETATLVLHWVL
jgi:hypothetical protein